MTKIASCLSIAEKDAMRAAVRRRDDHDKLETIGLDELLEDEDRGDDDESE